MIRTLFIFAIAFGLLGSAAIAQPQPAQPLKPGEVLQGAFMQERHLAGLSAPLHSEGTFVLAAGTGLIWRGEKPFATVMVITKGGILQMVGGAETQRLPATKLPFLTRFYDMLSGALSGDWSVLARDFTVTREGNDAAWKIALKPLHPDDPIATQIQAIDVAGGQFVDTVEIHRPGGDWEQLSFKDQSRAIKPLAPEDAALFAKAAN